MSGNPKPASVWKIAEMKKTARMIKFNNFFPYTNKKFEILSLLLKIIGKVKSCR